jgi:hypothetical protein
MRAVYECCAVVQCVVTAGAVGWAVGGSSVTAVAAPGLSGVLCLD